ncbi:ribonuclease H-like, partial [Polypterus senegalus]|uniref:ribonuclease H-like n=1 Tax=Polypterus senegalus TaxID=55291 RepID=UPI0019654E97
MAGAVIYEDPEDIPPVLPVVESPFKEEPAYSHLTPAQQENSWFTDGSATVEGGARLWRAVAYQPHTETILKQQGEGKSSHWAELIAVTMTLPEHQSFPVVVYTDSWAVFQGLTAWITMWRRAAWTIHGRELWGGTELWEQLWSMGTRGETLIGHVDAHAPLISLERLFNQQADLIAAVRELNLEEAYPENDDLFKYAEVNVIEPSLISLA